MYLLLLELICLLLFAAWLWRVPVPEEFSAPFTLRLSLMKEKLRYFYSQILEILGRQTRLQERRQRVQALLAALPPVKAEGVEMKDTELEGVKVRIYTPVSKSEDWKGFPGLVYIHCGGWVRGSIELFHPAMVEICNSTNTVILAVSYRFAPENPYPAPFDDCLKVTRHFLANAREYNVNPNRIAVGGASAGGNLTAAVMMKLRDDRFRPMPKRQILICPCLQALDFHTPSMIQNSSGPFLTRYIMAWYWSMYVSGSDKHTKAFLRGSHTSKEIKEKMAKGNLNHMDIGREFLYEPYRKPDLNKLPSDDERWEELRAVMLDPYCAPLVADDFSRLPPALVLTCNYDVLRDDGLLYVKRLQDAGVDVISKLILSGFHGIDIMLHFKEGRHMLDCLIDDIKTKV